MTTTDPEYQKRYYAAHRAHYADLQREYRASHQTEFKAWQKAYTEVRRAKKAAARLVAPDQIAASEGAEVEPGKRCLYYFCRKPITGRGAYHDYCDYYCYMAEFRRAYGRR